MKKNAILFCIGLLMTVFSQRSAAQSGLKILNDTKCNVDVTMYAIAPSMLYGCPTIISIPVTIPMAGGLGNWATPTIFDAYVGGVWTAIPTSPSPIGAGDFQFISADFTFWGCTPGVGCTPAGGSIGDNPLGCTSTSNSWFGGCGAYTINARWSPTSVPPAPPTTNIFLWFQH